MSTIDNEIAALKAAIATGALEVEYRSGDTNRRVKYDTLPNLMRRLAFLEQSAYPARRVSRTVAVPRDC